MANIVDRAASVYGKRDWNPRMLPTLTYVFCGVWSSGPGTLLLTFINKDVMGNPSITRNFTSTGFHPDFEDGYNQVFHFWASLATTANPNAFLPYSATGVGTRSNAEAHIGNILHETILGKSAGKSKEDFNLSLAAIDIGNRITLGEITPMQLGDILRIELGLNGSGAGGP